MNDKVVEGTTTVGITCKDGVVFATERKATMGNLVASKKSEKIFKINNHIATTIAGSVGQSQSLMKLIKAELSLYEMRNNAPMSVNAVSSLTGNILQSNPMYIQVLIGGYNEKEGASIYSLDPSGSVMPEDFTSTGSGSVISYGVLEDRYHEDLTIDEGIKVGIRAIKAASERDAFSGCGYLVAKIDKNGFELLNDEKVKEILNEI